MRRDEPTHEMRQQNCAWVQVSGRRDGERSREGGSAMLTRVADAVRRCGVYQGAGQDLRHVVDREPQQTCRNQCRVRPLVRCQSFASQSTLEFHSCYDSVEPSHSCIQTGARPTGDLSPSRRTNTVNPTGVTRSVGGNVRVQRASSVRRAGGSYEGPGARRDQKPSPHETAKRCLKFSIHAHNRWACCSVSASLAFPGTRL